MFRLVFDEKELSSMCSVLVFIIGLDVIEISFSVIMISFRLIRMWLKCFMVLFLCDRCRIMLKKISSGDSYDKLSVNICVMMVVFMLVFSRIVSVDDMFISFCVIKVLMMVVVVLLFCIRYVMLMLVSSVENWFDMLCDNRWCKFVLYRCNMLILMVCVFYINRVMLESSLSRVIIDVV